MFGLLCTAILSALAFGEPPDQTGSEPLLIEVDAGKHERINTPISFPVPPAFFKARTIGLNDVESGVPVPLQIVEGQPRSAMAVVNLPAGSKRRFRLSSEANGVKPSVGVKRESGAVTALVEGKPVWTYQSAIARPPAGIDPVYARSGFLHPMRTPAGKVVTDDFAADHPHQHGLFFAWTKTTFRGKAMNFWDQLQKTASVRNDLGSPDWAGGEASPVLLFMLKHEDITSGPEKAAPVLEERWTLTTYPQASPFLIDFESTQNAAGTDPLVINAYHYGGLGFRGNIAWFDPEVKGEDPPDPSRSGESDFLTSEGKTRADGNHARPKWLDLYGKVNGQFAGIAILQHPSNFRFPQPVRLHPNKPYFSVAPAVLGGFTIEQGTPYVSKYRIVLHDGKPDPRELDRLWNDYGEPPSVRLLAD